MKIRQSQVAACLFQGNRTAECPQEAALDDRELLVEGAISFVEAEIAF